MWDVSYDLTLKEPKLQLLWLLVSTWYDAMSILTFSRQFELHDIMTGTQGYRNFFTFPCRMCNIPPGP